MGDTLTLKWSKEDADRKAWAESQPEGATAALVRAALDALQEQRSHGGGRSTNHPTPSAPFDPDVLANAIWSAFHEIAPELGDAIGSAIQQKLLGIAPTIYSNQQVAPEPIMKAKRPTKNHHQPVVDVLHEDSPEDLEAATDNFMSMFG